MRSFLRQDLSHFTAKDPSAAVPVRNWLQTRIRNQRRLWRRTSVCLAPARRPSRTTSTSTQYSRTDIYTKHGRSQAAIRWCAPRRRLACRRLGLAILEGRIVIPELHLLWLPQFWLVCQELPLLGRRTRLLAPVATSPLRACLNSTAFLILLVVITPGTRKATTQQYAVCEQDADTKVVLDQRSATLQPAARSLPKHMRTRTMG